MVYVDANVFLDYTEKRVGPFGQPFHLYAGWVFLAAQECRFYIVFSDHTEREVRENLGNKDRLRKLLERLHNKLIPVRVTGEDVERARSMDPLNLPDAIHAAVAIRVGARYLVTRNLIDFARLVPYLREHGIRVMSPMAVDEIV